MHQVHTIIRVGDERDSRKMETFWITQKLTMFASSLPELIFDAFKCPFKRWSEIDFLGYRARRNIAIKLRHDFDRLDPRIDACV
jgi:hypothetical protein